MPEEVLREFYQRLYRTFGPQHWWPGETPFEVIVGAILTQNTNWRNVESALANLKEHELLSPQALHRLSVDKLAVLIKPAGYFNVKARRVKNFIQYLFENYDGELTAMDRVATPELRKEILAVNGIGPETADSILLYALQRPVFVIDAYTKRILYRHGLVDHGAEYTDMQAFFLQSLRKDLRVFNEYHALIVRTGKEYCRPTPRCEQCPLNTIAYSLQNRCRMCYKTMGQIGRLGDHGAGLICRPCQEREHASE